MSTTKSLSMLDNDTDSSAWMGWPGGVGTFAVVGTFGGATVSLQMLGPDGSTPLAVGDNTTLTANGAANFEMGAGQIRALVSGGSPTGLYATVNGVG